MAKSITPSTFVRNLTYGKLCELSDFLDPQDNWKKVFVNIYKPTGEPRYTQNHLRYFSIKASSISDARRSALRESQKPGGGALTVTVWCTKVAQRTLSLYYSSLDAFAPRILLITKYRHKIC